MTQAPGLPDHVSTTPASPTRRGLFITGMLMLVGIIPGMGLPGGLMLGIADRFFVNTTGSTVLRAIGESAWPLAIVVTVLLPLPLVPALRLVSRWRNTGVGIRLFAVLTMIFAWGLVLSLAGLALAARR